MASPVKLYQKEMHSNLGFFATWLPGDPIEVGNVGVLLNGRFRRETTLQEFGIGCDVIISKSEQNVHYTSTQGIKITTSAGAMTTVVAKAEMNIEFSRKGAFVFNASNLQQQHLANRLDVAYKILQAYKNNEWKRDWLLVDVIHSAECATIIVSEDSSAGLVLLANIEAPLSAVSLADPKIGLTVSSTRGKIIHIINGKKVHPLYSCLRLRAPFFGGFFGGPSVDPVRGTATSYKDIKLSKTSIARLGIDELLNS